MAFAAYHALALALLARQTADEGMAPTDVNLLPVVLVGLVALLGWGLALFFMLRVWKLDGTITELRRSAQYKIAIQFKESVLLKKRGREVVVEKRALERALREARQHIALLERQVGDRDLRRKGMVNLLRDLDDATRRNEAAASRDLDRTAIGPLLDELQTLIATTNRLADVVHQAAAGDGRLSEDMTRQIQHSLSAIRRLAAGVAGGPAA